MITHTIDPIYETQAGLFKLLAHPVRLAILETLRGGEQCVCHMEAVLGYRQAYLSQQLALLREAGLVVVRRDGWNVFYQLARPTLLAVLDASRAAAGGDMHSGEARVTGANCPCPKCAGFE